jgi:hypothetical protein
MASGTFRTPTCYAAGYGYSRYIYVEWTSTNNPQDNSSTISWEAYVGSEDSSTTTYVYGGPTTIKINGAVVLTLSRRKLFKGALLGSGVLTVEHDQDGTKSVSISIQTAIYSAYINNEESGTLYMSPNPVPTYNLTIDAGTGSTITVTRTYCAGAGDTGSLSAGDSLLCPGDILKIECAANSGYILSSAKVNEKDFTSGGTITVGDNVSISTTARQASSTVRATDANIESVSMITILSNSSSYYHSLQYSFGSESGYINQNGKTSASEVKFKNTSIAFTIPSTFYAQIPNARSGVCTITCRTYRTSSSKTILGVAETCVMNVTVLGDASVFPDVNVSINDTNPTTLALTGNSSVLIRYRSTVTCEVEATAQKSASIAYMRINHINMDHLPGANVIGKRVLEQVEESSFLIEVCDTRNFRKLAPRNLSMIPYIPLTCNPTCWRESPTSTNILMTVRGSYYNGSFGACANTLTLSYRYKTTEESNYSEWQQITTGISYVDGGYYTPYAITIGDNFNYIKNYDIEISAHDGNGDYYLTQIEKHISVGKGIPVFDWGSKDFTFNVPVNINIDEEEGTAWALDQYIPININGTNILDILYPDGAVYLSTSDNPPDFLQKHWGAWKTTDIGNDINAFTKR